ncbi:MAG: DUF1592 domain-containing protein [Polyangiales bacterium]|nr:DUF1592 domain-containing protein [Myxococcales bacterium]
MRGCKPFLLSGTTLGLCLLAGCLGAVDGAAGPLDGDPNDRNGDGIPDQAVSSLAACKDLTTVDVAPATMRRLNRVEYDNTLHDLGLVAANESPGSELAGDLSVGASKDRGFAVGGPVDDTLALDLVNSAIEIANRAVQDLHELTGCTTSNSENEFTCAQGFIKTAGQHLFRRPLSNVEQATFEKLYTDTRAKLDHRAGMEVTLASMLASPEFIYLFEAEPDGAEEGAVVPLDAWAMASRLSYFLWDSAPDEELYAAAAANELETPEQLAAQAERMLADPRARRAVLSFFRQWSLSRQLEGLTKDDEAFDDGMATALGASIDRTFEDAFFDENATLADLFRGTEMYANDTVAPLLGVEAGMGDEMVPVSVNADQRRGLLTHPALLTVLAKADRGDPIHRGLFIREKLLCMTLPDPPAEDADGNPINLIVPPPEPGQSNRDRFAAHTENEQCSGCHQLLDPLGFGFENYDAMGRFRTENEFGESIDASGEVVSGGDLTGTFHNATELAERIATSETVADCMAKQWFRFAMDRKEVSKYDACSTATAVTSFLNGNGTLKELVLGIVQSAGFRNRRVGGVTQ